MKRFELNWKNPIVRLFVFSMFPLIALTTVLFTTISSEWYFIPNGLLVIGTILIFFIRYLRYKKSNE
ncbi:hypothetical protein H9655_10775 [Cytobacillus sp. Sa5YUA1]|uniref:Uncharacterized protein n=1 Tax=Cytobacillus stercorigallinarum TaxID=2762240 RepID=A0ABR8QPU2_9BACI|nr:hypothetical protein [Cytobacillus stercorigallinarum]MBD7937508.1 hypothetical protein [Cytobacillus stercorigallinarum]